MRERVDPEHLQRSRLFCRHIRDASDATYIVEAFGDELLMQLQLNVHRLVVVYRVPALDALDANTLTVHLDRWRIGAEDASWKFGWRDAPIASDPGRRYVETYCYAFAATDFLEKRAGAALLAHRHCADDPVFHPRSRAVRRKVLAPKGRVPRLREGQAIQCRWK